MSTTPYMKLYINDYVGDHSIDNLTVACVACNLSKRDMLVCEWMETQQ